MGIIKANDIRGIFPEELDRETLYKIGFFLPQILRTQKILIGRDSRLSSDEIFTILARGINDAGADVIDIGLCDTPAVYFATVHYEFHGSVMITASHNPAEYNGLKISGSQAVPIGPQTGLHDLASLIRGSAGETASHRGTVEKLDIRKDYVAYVRKYLKGSEELKVVMDCGNGAASAYLQDIFYDSFVKSTVLFDEPDGRFPNHGPNPLEKESWDSIQAEILKQKADLGILFDGDADRAIFFDEKGCFISPDMITALLGDYFYVQEERTGPMFYDIRSSKSVSEFIASLGGTSAACGSGHASIKKLLKEEKGLYAGELSGHYYYSDNSFCDSGFITAAIICTVCGRSKRPLSALVSVINPYSFSGEINFSVKDQDRVLKGIPLQFPKGRVNTLDGIRLDFDHWWFILRPSGAEPLLRLVVEARDDELMMKNIKEITQIIKELDQ
jgi:phosphomannomutase